jgi:hypothetical protein
MKSTVLLAILLIVTLSSFAQDWVYVSSGADETKWYVKSEYVKKGDYDSKDNIRIWTKKELKKTTIKKSGKNVTYTNVQELQLIVADCSERKIKFVSGTVYDSQGKLIDSWSVPDYSQEWADVVPDSMGEAMLDKICELFN